MKYTLTSLCLFLSFYLYAQGNMQVSGKLIDKATQTPLEFATVSLISNDPDVSPQGGVTDLDGNYLFTVTPGTYTVKWEFISFKPLTRTNVSITENIDFGILALEQDVDQLDAAIVVAEKTTVDLRLDKKIYNIGKDLTVRGGTVSDVLDNVPSVSVDVEGNVALRGNNSVRILIDGRPSALVGINGAEALRQIPSEAIERVEVITSPSARYDAEGTAGIINIILRKNRIQGFNGSINLNGGYPERYGASVNLNYRTNKWNLFTNTGYRYRTSPGNASSETQFLFPDGVQTTDNVFINEQRDFDRLGRNYFTSFGAEYFINDNSSIVGNIVYRLDNDDDVTTNDIQRFDENMNLNERTIREEQEAEDETDLQFSLDYQNDLDENGQKLIATAQFSTSVEDQQANILETETTTNTINDVERTLEQEDETEGLIQIDWEKPVGENIQYEAGYRGNYRDITNSFFLEERQVFPNGPLVPDAGLNNTFQYEEFVNAVYGQYGQKFGEFSFLAGLRFEQTNIAIDQETTDVTDKKDYSSFFPTVNLGYELQEGENFTLGFNRRVRRPRGRSLNPFPSRSSEASIFQGNIDLNPTFSNQLDLGYLRRWEKLTLSTSIYFNRSTDNVETIQEQTGQVTDNGDQVIRRTPVNLSTEERLGYELTLTYNPFKWWTINSDLNVFRVETDGEFQSQNFDFVNTTYFVRLNQKFELPEEIDFQARINYRGASENAQGSQNGIATINLAASKDILQGQGSLTFNVSDLLNARRRESTTVTPNFISDSAFQYRERQFTMAFVYTFNQRKKENQERGGDEEEYEFEG
ncbi:outer membrane beta-barrel family protein [Nonlabens marinus]|uniref:TonB-dependent receptor, putative n=1 Tax=Nonlabens marinus S1-08 TaxID=1454201 RepID=W8W0L5_9FLAO|nr:outer membrane beta-barrel family protein [Nonlabens marinus]BAO56536.1 TonB-dependent receptor, putative [Nonlabens marinus S1-08]